MMGSLQLQYNRGRQAVITNELIDIITVSHAKSLLDEDADAPGCLGLVSGGDIDAAGWEAKNIWRIQNQNADRRVRICIVCGPALD